MNAAGYPLNIPRPYSSNRLLTFKLHMKLINAQISHFQPKKGLSTKLKGNNKVFTYLSICFNVSSQKYINTEAPKNNENLIALFHHPIPCRLTILTAATANQSSSTTRIALFIIYCYFALFKSVAVKFWSASKPYPGCAASVSICTARSVYNFSFYPKTTIPCMRLFHSLRPHFHQSPINP